MIWLVLLLAHILLCVLGGILCVLGKEKEWVLFAVLCLIPFGWLFVVYSYIGLRLREKAERIEEERRI